MKCLSSITINDVLALKENTVKAQFALLKIQNETSLALSHVAPKLFQVKRNLGNDETHKLICFIIANFEASLNVTNKMSSVQIFEAGQLIMERYPYESIQDFILALKEAKVSGRIFYNRLSLSDLFQILTEYLERKSVFLEEVNRAKDKQGGNVIDFDRLRESYQEIKKNGLPPDVKIKVDNLEEKYRLWNVHYLKDRIASFTDTLEEENDYTDETNENQYT